MTEADKNLKEIEPRIFRIKILSLSPGGEYLGVRGERLDLRELSSRFDRGRVLLKVAHDVAAGIRPGQHYEFIARKTQCRPADGFRVAQDVPVVTSWPVYIGGSPLVNALAQAAEPQTLLLTHEQRSHHHPRAAVIEEYLSRVTRLDQLNTAGPAGLEYE